MALVFFVALVSDCHLLFTERSLGMDELIARIAANVGIDESLAKTAVGIILKFLNKDGPADKVAPLLDALPGARELLAAQPGKESSGGGLLGGIGSLLGGLGGGMGAMAALSEMSSAGLDMDQVKGVTEEVVGFAKEKAGADIVDEVIASIPGLSQIAS